jgi:hypothetical protein
MDTLYKGTRIHAHTGALYWYTPIRYIHTLHGRSIQRYTDTRPYGHTILVYTHTLYTYAIWTLYTKVHGYTPIQANYIQRYTDTRPYGHTSLSIRPKWRTAASAYTYQSSVDEQTHGAAGVQGIRTSHQLSVDARPHVDARPRARMHSYDYESLIYILGYAGLASDCVQGRE